MITNILTGILLGFSIFKIGELVLILYRSKFTIDGLNEAFLDKKKTSKEEIVL